MLEHFHFLLKLWDKGIDITSSVITSVIVTGIALLGWKVKLHFDLKSEEAKQRQQHRIAKELSQPETAEARKRLRSELGSYIALLNQDANVGNSDGMQDTWNGFVRWLAKNNLEHLPDNQQMMAAISETGKNLKNTSFPSQNLPLRAKVLIDAISNTKFYN